VYIIKHFITDFFLMFTITTENEQLVLEVIGQLSKSASLCISKQT